MNSVDLGAHPDESRIRTNRASGRIAPCAAALRPTATALRRDRRGRRPGGAARRRRERGPVPGQGRVLHLGFLDPQEHKIIDDIRRRARGPIAPEPERALADAVDDLFDVRDHWAEIPALPALGLAARFGAAGLSIVNAVAVIAFADLSDLGRMDHLLWGVLLLVTLLHGPGRLSVDYWIKR